MFTPIPVHVEISSPFLRYVELRLCRVTIPTPILTTDPLPVTVNQADLMAGEDTVRCPSCSLLLRVIYDIEDFAEVEEVAAPVLPTAEVVN